MEFYFLSRILLSLNFDNFSTLFTTQYQKTDTDYYANLERVSV